LLVCKGQWPRSPERQARIRPDFERQFRQLFPDDVLAVPQEFVHLAAHQVVARVRILVVQEGVFEFFPAQVQVEMQDVLQLWWLCSQSIGAVAGVEERESHWMLP
jgi:hypothetical protein